MVRKPATTNGPRGRMSLQFTVSCGGGPDRDCSEWTHVAGFTGRQAVKDAERIGWRFTADRGWLCPTCYDALPVADTVTGGGST